MILDAIRIAVYQRLVNYPALDGLLARSVEDSQLPAIYDHVPQAIDPENDAAFPFLTLDNDAISWDTDTDDGFDDEVSLHAWTRYGGRREALLIQDACFAALHEQPEELTITGGRAALLQHVSARVYPEPDGRTYRGEQRFRLLAEVA